MNRGADNGNGAPSDTVSQTDTENGSWKSKRRERTAMSVAHTCTRVFGIVCNKSDMQSVRAG